MKLAAAKSFFNDPEKWQNFDCLIMGNGNRVYATSVMGFRRKRKLVEPDKIPGFNQYRHEIYDDNWYFTWDPNEQPSIGTLELDEELNVIRYQEVIEGRIVEVDIDNIITFMYKRTDTHNYPGIAPIV